MNQESPDIKARVEIYRFLAESSQDFLYLVNPDMKLLFVNRAGAELLGKSPEALVGNHIRDIFPETADRQIKNIQHVLSTGESLSLEHPYYVKGHEIWMNARLFPVRNEADEVIAVAGTSLDITHRKMAEFEQQRYHEALEKRVEDRTRELSRINAVLEEEVKERQLAESALRESEERFKTFFNTSPLLSSINTLEDQRFVEVNPAFLRTLGYEREDVIGRTVNDLTLYADEPRRDEGRRMMLEQGCVRNLEMRVRTKDGKHRYGVFNVDLFTLHEKRYAFVTMSDITEQKLLERQILQTQKLESLGVMAGGIAHDINNLLVGIIGNTELALLDLPAESDVRSKIEDIRTAGDRLSDLTNQMLAFAGRGRFQIEPIDITGAVKEMVKLVAASISRKIELSLDLKEGIPAVNADNSQVRQVILNLLTNAAEAIGDQPGKIIVRTGLTAADDTASMNSYFNDPVQPGPYVFLEVDDTGGGIRADAMEHIFDPFFTTKFTGRGLGLAAVAGIVRNHGGLIQIDSREGTGTLFRILLPGTYEEVAAERRKARDPEVPEGVTVLVVDDDASVREITRKYLEKAGYAVRVASNGKEAVEAVRLGGGDVRAVLIDLTMPEMDGIEAAREIMSIRGDLPVVLTSGYTGQHAEALCGDVRMAGFIQKPYGYRDLVSLIGTLVRRD